MCNCKNIDESNETLRALLKKKDEVIKRLHNENEERVYIRQSLETRIKELEKENESLRSVLGDQRGKIQELTENNEKLKVAMIDKTDIFENRVNSLLNRLAEVKEQNRHMVKAFMSILDIVDEVVGD